MTENIGALAYLVAGVMFILALRGLSSPETARRGNLSGMIGMFIAVVTTLYVASVTSGTGVSWGLVISGVVSGGVVGAFIAQRVSMTAMPQLVAGFHSFVGLAAVLVAAAAFYTPEAYGIGTKEAIRLSSLIEMSLGSIVGAVTFSGSIVAFTKLQGLVSGAPVVFRGQHKLNAVLGMAVLGLIVLFCQSQSQTVFWLLAALAFVLGILIIIPIGGADMPVVVSMLNSYSGWAAAGIGFTLNNTALIITGALVGSSGAILSYIMCKSMNRPFWCVLMGGVGGKCETAPCPAQQKPVNQGSSEDAAFILNNANSVVIVPGYGMAVAQAQHAIREMADTLKKRDVQVSYAIHPVAGRMPGHMNVLLAEANVPYDEVFELDDINNEFPKTSAVLVVGANDVTNPAAKNDPTSSIYGMQVLDVEKAETVLFVKRGLGCGYAGVDNALFYRENTMMLFGDAKKVVEDVVKSL
jgi:NAD(P) transhydrogenase subunit beta